MPRRTRHIRGTKIRTFRFGRLWRLWARATGRVTLAGVPLSRDDETMHVAAIGATGSGKSTALRALMSDAMLRGDRHLVADPEGTAMEDRKRVVWGKRVSVRVDLGGSGRIKNNNNKIDNSEPTCNSRPH